MPVNANWMYDFGDKTKAQLDGLATPDITAKIGAAKAAASSMIGSGAFGSATATYRIIVRSDALSASGYSVEIRFVA